MSNFDRTMAARVRDAVNSDDDDYEWINGVQVLKDGRTARHRMSAMDSASAPSMFLPGSGEINPALTPQQQSWIRRVLDEKAKATQATHDGWSGPRREYSTSDARRFGLTSGMQLARPGFRYNPDVCAKDEAIIAYHDRDLEDAEAWRNGNPPAGQGAAAAPRGAKEGDSCKTGGMEGHLVEIDGELTCIPDSVDDAASLSDREIAHLKYLDHVSNAWRTPDAHVVSDHRPAQRADVAPTRDAVEAAYAAYDAEIQERWRNPT